MSIVIQSSFVDDIPEEVYQELNIIGVQSHLIGYDYLAYGISLAVSDLGILNSMTKRFYPEVATAFNSTPSRVERAIRHSIDKVFDTVEPNIIYEYFGNTLDLNKLKTTNTQFIATVARVVRRKILNKDRLSET